MYLIPLILGIISGIFTGLTPGIHINLIISLLLTQQILSTHETNLIIYIISISITHTFIDFIPSIYLGAASEDTINSILPGHKYLLSGQGHKAVKLTIIGSTIAVISSIIIIPILYIFIKYSYNLFEQMIGFILIIIIMILLSKEQQSKILAILIFFLTGTLGTITLNSQINEPLLPLLTGLFGSSTIINSITTRTRIPKQKITKLKIKIKDIKKPTLKTIIVSPLCSLLPGLGASQAATLSQNKQHKKSNKEYLILLGSINTLIMITSFFTLYLINKKRTGAANAIAKISIVTPQILQLIIYTIIITTIIVIPLTNIISKQIAKNIHKINYKKTSIIILIILTTLIIYISGFTGFIIYLTSTTLGLFTIKSNITRSHLMGVILLPTTLYYLPLF